MKGACVAAFVGWLFAAPALGDDKVDYTTQIKPIFTQHCNVCHGAVKQKSGIRLDAGVLIHRGTEDAKLIAPGKADQSLLIHAVLGTEGVERMPKDGKPLSDEQIALLKRWINEGAAYPKEEIIPLDPAKHWAFNAPKKAAVPNPKNAAWAKNPIDAFIAAEHEKRGLVPLEEAEPAVLVRRVYLDLIGLPPTEAEVQAFVKEITAEASAVGRRPKAGNAEISTADGARPTAYDSGSAYDRVVNKLLASPRYGERWGRHWMDVWRYSDWYGYKNELRNSQKHIWRWRDWIIESLNEDKPYDRMVIEMLAADEAAPNDQDALRATGFLTRNYYKFNRHVWLDSTVEHTSKAFLGITMNCARCHDHMYDPISQQEYYDVRAIFEPHQVRYDRVPGGGADAEKNGLSRAYDAELEAKTFLFERGNDKMPRKDLAIIPNVPKVLAGTGELSITSVSLSAEGYYEGMRDHVRREALAAAQKDRVDRKAALMQAEEALAQLKTKDQESEVATAERRLELAQKQLAAADAELVALRARFAADDARYASPAPPDAEALARRAAAATREANAISAEAAVVDARIKLALAEAALQKDEKKNAKPVADAKKALENAEKAADKAHSELKKDDANYPAFGKQYPATSTGRRLALAQWIASKKNPLTARVAVNHIWMRHFGRPLVPTVFDFGLNGKPPTHPELLDWLAVEFMEHGWSHKHLHRLIVTSRAYRTASTAKPTHFRGWASNAQIDPDNQYLWRTNPRRMEAEIVRDSVIHLAGRLDTTMGGPELDENAGLTSYRRSVYYRHAMEKQMVFLEMFDVASPTECYRRAETIAPQQALALVNSSMSLDMARLIARDLAGGEREDASDEAFVLAAFERILCRAPSEQERAACVAFLAEQSASLPGDANAKLNKDEKPGQIKPSSVPRLRAKENLVHVLLNHHEFVTIR